MVRGSQRFRRIVETVNGVSSEQPSFHSAAYNRLNMDTVCELWETNFKNPATNIFYVAQYIGSEIPLSTLKPK